MRTRLSLHEKLCELLGSRNCYFQPPESLKINYPCIIYSCENGDSQYANNSTYLFVHRYQLIVIDKNPDSDIPEKIVRAFSGCVSGRNYQADNLNHFVLYIYY